MKKAVFFILFIFLFGCFSASAEKDDFDWIVEEGAFDLPPDPRHQARMLMRNMSDEEKIGQLLMVSAEDLTGEKRSERIENTDVFLNFPVGGIILYGQNIASENQLKALTDDIYTHSRSAGIFTPFVAVDEEGGSVIRIANKLGLESAPSAEIIGAGGDAHTAYNAGRMIGSYLSSFGINLDLAPVADVLITDSPELDGRTYGSDPQLVSSMALEMAKGLGDEHILSCYKHFPGHGTITKNTHNVPTGHDRTLEEMEKAELIPFQQAILADADMIMTSHLKARALDGEHPCSLSPILVNGLLRSQMGYDGVVICDALRMDAIREEYSVEDAVILALHAGTDILLVPGNGREAYRSIEKALETGELTWERIDLSVERILALKIKRELIQ